ncbi:MAG: aldo/keto reductase [Spirochaetales bacterium]|nr:aldo/keto reductase [Spirochaetales bacterium]
MKLVELGKTGIAITSIGLGCWQFSEGKGFSGKFWPALHKEDVLKIIEISVKGGITWFDTAEIYGWGASERILSASLQELDIQPGNVFIATKWFPAFRRAASIRKTFPQRAEMLSPYPIDLHQVHMPWSLSSVEKQMNQMADLFDEGKIRSVGVSNFSRKKMEKAADALAKRNIPLASNQMRYSLLDRSIEQNGVMECAKERGITIIAYSPLAQGLVTGKYHENPDMIKKMPGPRKLLSAFKPKGLAKSQPLVDLLKKTGTDCNATAAEVALAWLVQRHEGTVVAIPGASKPHHAEQNVRALNLKLKNEEIEKIDQMSWKVLGKER